ARREVDEAELGIDGRRLPDGGAAVLPRVVVARPSVVPELARTRDRMERPHELAVARVEGLHAAARRAVAAREARDHEAVVVERRRRDAEAVSVSFGLRLPDDSTGRGVERDELAVELAREDFAFAERDAAAHPAAADDGDVRIEIRLVR